MPASRTMRWRVIVACTRPSDSKSATAGAAPEAGREKRNLRTSHNCLLPLYRIQGRPSLFDCLCEVRVAKWLIDHEVNGASEDLDEGGL